MGERKNRVKERVLSGKKNLKRGNGLGKKARCSCRMR